MIYTNNSHKMLSSYPTILMAKVKIGSRKKAHEPAKRERWCRFKNVTNDCNEKVC